MAAFDWEMEAVRWAFMHKRVATKVVCVGAETRAKSDYIFATDGSVKLQTPLPQKQFWRLGRYGLPYNPLFSILTTNGL